MRKNLPPFGVLLYYALAAPFHTQQFIGISLAETLSRPGPLLATIAKTFKSLFNRG